MPTDRHSADDADHNQSTSGEQSSHNTTATVIPEVDSDSSETSAAPSSRPSHSQRPANSQSRNVEESAKAEAPEDSEVLRALKVLKTHSALQILQTLQNPRKGRISRS